MATFFNFFYKSFYILFTLKDKGFGVIPFFEENGQRFYLVTYSHHNRWVFSKGHRLIGEDEISAAKRELKEETGISDIELIPNFHVMQRYNFKLSGLLPVKKNVKLFVGRVKNKRVKLDQKELEDFKWVTIKEDLSEMKERDVKAILENVDRHLAKVAPI